MKTLIAIIMILLPAYSFGSESCQTQPGEEVVQEKMVIDTKVPENLKGATIIVRTADGKEEAMPVEKFKVVPRKQQYVVTKVKQQVFTTCNEAPKVETVVVTKVKTYKNRISLLAGEGPNKNVDITRSGSSVTMESKSGADGGIQYQRSLTERLNVGVQLQTNETGLLSVGLDF
jgi:hypothetical protein